MLLPSFCPWSLVDGDSGILLLGELEVRRKSGEGLFWELVVGEEVLDGFFEEDGSEVGRGMVWAVICVMRNERRECDLLRIARSIVWYIGTSVKDG